MVAVGRTPRIGGHGRPSISVPFAPHDRNAALESNLMLQSADFSQLKSQMKADLRAGSTPRGLENMFCRVIEYLRV